MTFLSSFLVVVVIFRRRIRRMLLLENFLSSLLRVRD